MKLYRDHFQNFKRYNIPKAQLIIADIPYNIGKDAYGSRREFWKDGRIDSGVKLLKNKTFFKTDVDFKVPEFMHFASQMLKKEPKRGSNKAGCMIVFCEFLQQFELIEQAKKYGFNKYINLVFRKNYSPQALKANQKVLFNSEYGVLFYRDKLPKFNNDGKMVFNCMDYKKDMITPRIHPNQKSIHVIKRLIEIFSDEGDVVIDPVAGSGVTLLAAEELGRESYGFEIEKKFVDAFNENFAKSMQLNFNNYQGDAKRKIN